MIDFRPFALFIIVFCLRPLFVGHFCGHLKEKFDHFLSVTETTFAVSLAKGSRGLGLSVTGGIDSGGSWPGLIRVKRLFPHQPAAVSGVLNVGDLILEANGVALTGLTNYVSENKPPSCGSARNAEGC